MSKIDEANELFERVHCASASSFSQLPLATACSVDNGIETQVILSCHRVWIPPKGRCYTDNQPTVDCCLAAG